MNREEVAGASWAPRVLMSSRRGSVCALLLLSLSEMGCHASPRDATSLRVEHLSRGGYVIVDVAGNQIPERDFARLYKARTGSSALDGYDRAQNKSLVLGTGFGGTLLAVATLSTTVIAGTRCGDPATSDSCGRATQTAVVTGALGALVLTFTIIHSLRGSPEDHDLPRERAEDFVRRYNDGKAATISPAITPSGLGFTF